ncbi:MAG: type I DNA topoisomerase [Bacteroidia bacterium]|nr:type I DNA topoisomerase [Bacteroidia bacterium]
MADNLVIVESPAKAKTIENFLGKDFEVKSSYGHIRDLPRKKDAVDIENAFTPRYEISKDKESVVKELKKLCKNAKTVWLATDEDREGEAIAWHLSEALELENKKTKRIVFHEITKKAILDSIENSRSIDMNLVNAQQARRILDRLVGFNLSPLLWKKIKPELSAGRVQSVAVRLIVEREREIEAFDVKSFFRVTAMFLVTDDKGKVSTMKAELSKKYNSEQDANEFVISCVGAKFSIKNLEKKPSKKSPAAPFTTSTLQQEASRKLGYSVAQTMVVAQKLYEAGKITYMRTDSVNLSDTALESAEKQIKSAFGDKYSNRKRYKTKNSSAQEAHEAIRPTDMKEDSIDGDSSQKRLYDLIYKRTLASQMTDAELERTIVHVQNDKNESIFTATGEIITFDGFLKVYLESTDDEETEKQSGLLPPLKEGQGVGLDELLATERFSRPPARYTEASLVKKLEELGIGRPSTYAPTISTVQKRGYVLKEEREGRERNYQVISLKNDKVETKTNTEITGAERNKMFPADIGRVVNDFLIDNFKNIMQYDFTANVEKEFDEIAQGDLEWHAMIEEFYTPFSEVVKKTEEHGERASGERQLGIHPKSGKRVSVRIARFGPVAQLTGDDEEEKPQYARLKPGQNIETLTLEEALELFKLPRNLGKYEEQDVTVAMGRFGPYVRHKDAFFSVPKGEDPTEISFDRAIEIIEAKRKADREKLIKEFDENEEVKILNGRWGPYISFGKKNIRIPKDTDPKSLSYEQVVEMEKNYVPSRRAAAKKKTATTAKKKTTAKKTTKKKITAKKTTTKKSAAKKTTTKKTKPKSS